MIETSNECVGCPPERGCLGAACPHRNVVRLYCDACGKEFSALYDDEGFYICGDCLLERFPIVRAEDFMEY